jgi:hypothetical protein
MRLRREWLIAPFGRSRRGLWATGCQYAQDWHLVERRFAPISLRLRRVILGSLPLVACAWMFGRPGLIPYLFEMELTAFLY